MESEIRIIFVISGNDIYKHLLLLILLSKGDFLRRKKNYQKEVSLRTVASRNEAENCSYSYTHLVRVTNFNCCHNFNSMISDSQVKPDAKCIEQNEAPYVSQNYSVVEPVQQLAFLSHIDVSYGNTVMLDLMKTHRIHM